MDKYDYVQKMLSKGYHDNYIRQSVQAKYGVGISHPTLITMRREMGILTATQLNQEYRYFTAQLFNKFPETTIQDGAEVVRLVTGKRLSQRLVSDVKKSVANNFEGLYKTLGRPRKAA